MIQYDIQILIYVRILSKFFLNYYNYFVFLRDTNSFLENSSFNYFDMNFAITLKSHFLR